MGTFSRLSDIINSNINAILDEADDPEKMLRLVTKEMQESLDDVRAATARGLAEHKRGAGELAGATRAVAQWDTRAELAIRQGREDLARAALAEKQNAETRAIHLEAEMAALSDTLVQQQADTSRLEEKLSAAKSRQHSLVLRGQTARSRLQVKRQLSNSKTVAAFDRFSEYERKLDDLEGSIEAYDLGSPTLEAELGALEADAALDAQLSALKTRVGCARQQS